MPSIRLGTASPSSQSTTPETLSLLSTLAQRAASKSIDILLLPEAFLGGYPRGSTFGCVVGSRTAEGREEFAAYFDNAVDLGDTVGNGAGAGEKWVKRQIGEEERGDGTREELERVARETGVFIVTGLVEKAGGSLYCAAVYVCPKHGIIGKRRKVMPTGMERLIWAQGCPSTLRAVTTTIRNIRINLAAAICWENYMPLLRQSLYAQNINLYLAPTADERDAWLSLMRTVGVEGRCFVVSSNMAVRNKGEEGSGERGRERQVLGRMGRQASVVSTDTDGHEIALPMGKTSPTRTRQRRKSVMVEDGNEIVLCAPAEDREEAAPNALPNGTTPSPCRIGTVHEESTEAPPLTSTKTASWASRGGSCIIDPFGNVLAGPQWEDEDGIIYADVDFRECIKGRLDLDAGGSYSRNDSFNLSVKGLDMDPLPY